MLNNSNKIQKRKKSAFSFIELSVIMAIIAIIISGYISVSTNNIKNAKIKITKDRIKTIQHALHIFVYNNKRLPCPASLHDITTDTAYGTEAGTSGTCTATGALTSTNTAANDGLIYGAVPVKDLGLDIELMGDAFDNKFSYIVPQQLTETFVNGGAVGFEGADMSDTVNLDPIEIRSTGTITTLIGAYVVLSHGPNGFRAFNINSGSIQNGSSTSTDEEDNSPTGVSGGDIFDKTFITSSNDSGFDDIVVYSTRELIVKDIGGFSTTVCTTETSDFSPGCLTSGNGLTFPARYYDGTTNVNSNETCASIAGCSSGTATRKCGLNGQWESAIDGCI